MSSLLLLRDIRFHLRLYIGIFIICLHSPFRCIFGELILVLVKKNLMMHHNTYIKGMWQLGLSLNIKTFKYHFQSIHIFYLLLPGIKLVAPQLSILQGAEPK